MSRSEVREMITVSATEIKFVIWVTAQLWCQVTDYVCSSLFTLREYYAPDSIDKALKI